MKSMTGYGKAFAEKEGRKIVVELKAVNHRFLDLNFKLPRAFAAFEDKIRRIVSARVVRGHVDVFLTYADNGLRPKRVDADLQLAKGILDCAELLKNEFDLINDFQLTSLMKTPDVVTVTFDDDAPEILEALLSEAVAEAAEKLDEMRVAEGARLAADMCARIDEIENVLQSVKARAPFVAAEYRKKLAERIREAVGNSVEVDEARLLNEAAFFADKSNIDEEIERLASHIAQNYGAGRRMRQKIGLFDSGVQQGNKYNLLEKHRFEFDGIRTQTQKRNRKAERAGSEYRIRLMTRK